MERSLKVLEGVDEVVVNLARGTATLTTSSGEVSAPSIVRAVRAAGYDVGVSRIRFTVDGMSCASDTAGNDRHRSPHRRADRDVHRRRYRYGDRRAPVLHRSSTLDGASQRGYEHLDRDRHPVSSPTRVKSILISTRRRQYAFFFPPRGGLLIALWVSSLSAHYGARFEPADWSIYHGVGWQVQAQNAYCDMLPDDMQPLLFQVMAPLPGGRSGMIGKGGSSRSSPSSPLTAG